MKFNMSLLLIKQHAMKMYRKVEVQLQAFFTSALDEGEWLALLSGPFIKVPR
jgi:hypothetical protein